MKLRIMKYLRVLISLVIIYVVFGFIENQFINPLNWSTWVKVTSVLSAFIFGWRAYYDISMIKDPKDSK